MPRLTAAIPMDNPYCSCQLRGVLVVGQVGFFVIFTLLITIVLFNAVIAIMVRDPYNTNCAPTRWP